MGSEPTLLVMESDGAISAKSREATSNEELAERARAGSSRDFAELYDRLGPRLYNFLLRRVRDPEVTEDLTQEAFLRAWKSLDRYDRRWRFSTWLFTIGSRLASNHLRTRGRMASGRETAPLPSSEPDPERAAMRLEQRGRLWAMAERTLSPDQLSSLWLRYAEELPMSEVARILDKSNVAVRVLLFRARRTLAEAILDEEKAREHLDEPRAPRSDRPSATIHRTRRVAENCP